MQWNRKRGIQFAGVLLVEADITGWLFYPQIVLNRLSKSISCHNRYYEIKIYIMYKDAPI